MVTLNEITDLDNNDLELLNMKTFFRNNPAHLSAGKNIRRFSALVVRDMLNKMNLDNIIDHWRFQDLEEKLPHAYVDSGKMACRIKYLYLGELMSGNQIKEMDNNFRRLVGDDYKTKVYTLDSRLGRCLAFKIWYKQPRQKRTKINNR